MLTVDLGEADMGFLVTGFETILRGKIISKMIRKGSEALWKRVRGMYWGLR